jgi:hypothetical protein
MDNNEKGIDYSIILLHEPGFFLTGTGNTATIAELGEINTIQKDIAGYV